MAALKKAAKIFVQILETSAYKFNEFHGCFKGVLGMVKISDLRSREVVNVVDGRRLGLIKDIDIDLEEGRITSIILPGVSGKFLGFLGREEEIIVPWDKIMKIGADVILVEISSFTDPKHEFKINY